MVEPKNPAPASASPHPFTCAKGDHSDQGPRYAPRMISWSLCAMALAAIVYACMADLDVVVTTQGRIIPSGKSKTVQPLEAGVVRTIAVRDGQHVKEGDVLLELDPTATNADRQRVQRELWEAQADLARLRALATDSSPQLPADLPADIAIGQRALLANRRSEQRSRLAALDADIARRLADHNAIAAGITQLRTSQPLLKRKNEMREDLARTGHIAEAAVLDTRLELINLDKELAVQLHRLEESRASVRAAVEQRDQAASEFKARIGAELMEATRRGDGAQQDLVKVQKRLEQQVLKAPISGVVQQLAVTTVGGVVTAAQPLLTIVPENMPLEVDAQVLNRDVGHLRVGQRVINKVETFDFTRFGYIEGEVQWVGTDAIMDPRLGPVYPVRIKLHAGRTPRAVNGVPGLITAGMSVVADIRTDQRRMIEYFLAPLLRYRQEALRER